MQNFQLRSPLCRLSTLATTTAGLMMLALSPATAYTSVTVRDYEICAGRLVQAGITPEAAASACAAALYPQDVATCVNRIKGATAIAPTDVLAACQRVRRPVELASCYTRILTSDSAATQVDVLETCRRSLLPERLADCVVGLRRQIEFPTATALQTCIQAGDRPTNAAPGALLN